MVRASNLRLNGLDLRSILGGRTIGTEMDDHLPAGIASRYVTSHLGQLSLLPSVGREMSTGQSTVMRCSWGVVDKRVGGS